MKITPFAGAAALALVLAACGQPGEDAAQGADAASANAGSVPAAEARMAMPTQDPAAGEYAASGEVTAIEGEKVTISHGPVEALGWPSMTMAFAAASADQLTGLEPGDAVQFGFRQDGPNYVLTSIAPQAR